MAPSAYSSRTSLSTYNSGRTSTSSEHSIHLLCSIPGQLPRSSAPTPQRLIHVAASLSVHLSNADLAHAFLGRFSLFLRGADVSPRWVDADVIKPIIGGLQRVKDVLAINPEFAIHGEVAEGGVDRLLVSHRCGIYVRLSVGYVLSSNPFDWYLSHSQGCRIHQEEDQLHFSSPQPISSTGHAALPHTCSTVP